MLCWVAASLFMLVMVAAVALQVISRYVFFSPPSWTEELARYCMIWAGYLGATVAFYRREDPVLVATQFVNTSFFSVLVSLIQNIAVLLFLIPIIYWSPDILSHHLIRETESLKLNSTYVMLIVPIFASVIVVHVMARLLSPTSKV